MTTTLAALLAKHGPAPFTNTLQLLDVLKSIPAEYPPGLLAARRIAFTRQIEAHQTDTDGLWLDPHNIAVNVAQYNVAHVSDRNKAWAERRLQEELNKGGDCNE